MPSGVVVGSSGELPGVVPRFAAVVGALNDLPEPAARLGGVDPVRIGERALHVIDLPAAEMRAIDFPFLPLAIGCENERALRVPTKTRIPLILIHLWIAIGVRFNAPQTQRECDYWQNACAIRSCICCGVRSST